MAARLESGEAQAAAVAAELDGWRDGRAGGGGAAREATKHLLRPADGDAEMAAACDELALGVLNGAIARLDGALAVALAKWRHARCAWRSRRGARAANARRAVGGGGGAARLMATALGAMAAGEALRPRWRAWRRRRHARGRRPNTRRR